VLRKAQIPRPQRARARARAGAREKHRKHAASSTAHHSLGARMLWMPCQSSHCAGASQRAQSIADPIALGQHLPRKEGRMTRTREHLNLR
jgi:hypothetical protein